MFFISHTIHGANISACCAVVNGLELEYRSQVFQFVLERTEFLDPPRTTIIFKVDAAVDDRRHRLERALKLLPTKV